MVTAVANDNLPFLEPSETEALERLLENLAANRLYFGKPLCDDFTRRLIAFKKTPP
jgi:hypothetical protein